MKKTIIFLLLFSPVFVHAQLGIKAGLNFAKVASASDINNKSQSGFNVGIIFTSPTKKILSFQSELLYSKQGYNYKTATNTGNVNLNYFTQAQIMCINITKFFQIQFGAQTAILLNANVDSSKKTTGATDPYANITDFYNRFDYGYAVGFQVHPFKGLLIGARYNVSLAKIYSGLATYQVPSFTSEDAKNNVVQLFAGWKFGGGKSKKE